MKKYLYRLLCIGLLTGLCLMSCTDEDWSSNGNTQKGIALSPYKEKQVSRAMEPGDKYFKEGTKYRIWIMNQGGSTPEESTEEETGIEATETRRGDIPIIGIRPIEQTTPDFYGFTQNSQTDVPEAKAVTGTYPIELQPDGDYIDYLRGELKAPYEDSDYAQGDILQMPFKHIMSQVTFQVSKDTELDTDIQLVSVEMVGANTDNPTGITSEGTYQVYNNTFVFTSDAIRRIEGNNMDVPSADLGSDNVGEVATILVFPTFGTVTEEQEVPLTYLRVTFKDLNNYYEIADGDGNSTVLVPIYNTITSVEGTTEPLEFKQNYAYTLHIAFSSDIRRVVTLVPKVYEWIEGEGNTDNGFMQEQDMGQPVTFNGVLWSDRNLGATSGNPGRSVEDWYNSVGYLYQYGRNIPYYPYTENADHTIDYTTSPQEALQNNRLIYPVIDYASWGLDTKDLGWNFAPNDDDTDDSVWEGKTWFLQKTKNSNALLVWDLDKEKVLGKTVDFGYYANSTSKYRLSYLKDYDNGWLENTNTPCPPGWRLPTVQDFMGVMPSSGFSGNITFRKLIGIESNGSWMAEDHREMFISDFSADNISNMVDNFYKNDGQPIYKGAFPYIYRKETDDMWSGDKNNIGVYILSMGGGDRTEVVDKSNTLSDRGAEFKFNWGVIYGIKNQGTRNAYRVRWRIELMEDVTNEPKVETVGTGEEQYTRYTYEKNPFHGFIVVSRYETSPTDNFEVSEGESYKVALDRYDWGHPVEEMYFPIGGYCDAEDSEGELRNIGTEVWYATSELNEETSESDNPKKKMVWIKYAGTNSASQTIAVSDESTLGAAVFVRCVRDLYN